MINKPTPTFRAASSFFLLLLVHLSFLKVVISKEERENYIVLLEGEGAAFNGGSQIAFPANAALRETARNHSAVIRTEMVKSHDQFLMNNLESGSYKKLYSFHHLVNAFALHTTPSQVEKINKAKGVRLIEKDRCMKLMTTYTPQFLGLPTGPWSKGGKSRAGEGVVIGIVDTGIYPFHRSFTNHPFDPYCSDLPRFTGTCDTGPFFPIGSCNGKIVSARFFSAGALAVMPLNASRDYLSPFDASGHGSHVAAVAAGNSDVPVIVDGFNYGSASGMAPRARIAVYKAIYPDVGTLVDVVAAIDQAVSDGVDVMTLSIGPDETPQDTLTFLSVLDIILLLAQRAGVFVVQAAGNKGPSPSTLVSFSPWIMTVAASSTDRTYSATLVLGNGLQLQGVGLSELAGFNISISPPWNMFIKLPLIFGHPTGPTLGNGFLKYRLVFAKDAAKVNNSTLADECQEPKALQEGLVRGSIVVCNFSSGFYRRTSTLDAILATTKSLGAMGFVFAANPTYGDFVAEPITFSIPGIMIPSVSSVEALMQYYAEKTVRNEKGVVLNYGAQASIVEGRRAKYGDEAPVVSSFSSRGPDIIDAHLSLADVLKPDILAPGHQVWSAWSPTSAIGSILTGYNFALLSGTSMACPHVAGIAALLKHSYPSWSPSMIASAMITTASKNDNKGKPIMAAQSPFANEYQPATPFDFGGGLINAAAALHPGLVVNSGFEDYISFLCSLPNVNQETVRTATGRACNNSKRFPSDLNIPSITISALVGNITVQRTFKNVENRTETYLCSVLPPEGVEIRVFPTSFTIDTQLTQDLKMELKATKLLDAFSFGEILLTGSLDHIVRIPLSVFPVSLT
ncbi:subtilisin-like protease SBT2.4 isoform X1 [Amborella trichopoda]|uniref:subtilisin-like protease SBT2.4 isoform X1 n=1 Tax=Amborella trichopoda TaxID=13333 RepID=UPI0009BD6209|nr:subtilisin-like protease SBT2.4 isoform X1 [Amborella trichopoda]|eukprot:XP_020519220.1 subtilisin-like protease SBT2.4 isoform X1 [Amborella trichopoda]